MEMSKRDIAKKMTAFVVGAGVTKIVAGVIANNTAPTRVTDKVSIVAAAFVLGGIAADAASKYTDSQIDKTERRLGQLAATLVQSDRKASRG